MKTKEKVLCTHPIDGRARLIEIKDHKLILIERCTKCMRKEWILEGREGIDYPKTYTQEEYQIASHKSRIDILAKEHYRIIKQIQKELEQAFIKDIGSPKAKQIYEASRIKEMIDTVFIKYSQSSEPSSIHSTSECLRDTDSEKDGHSLSQSESEKYKCECGAKFKTQHELDEHKVDSFDY